MAVNIQTWGAMGSMVAEQREFGAKTAEYLEANEVYDLFGHLLKQIVIHQPSDPLKFLQEQLRNRPPLSVCIMGPPGIGRTAYCQKLSSEFGVKHIHVGKMLRSDKGLSELLKNGELIDDATVISLVKAEIKKAKGSGYILDGFPRTKVQAQILSEKELGFSLDNVILLNASENAIKENFAQKLAVGKATADREDLINLRLQQYYRHVIGIAEMFKNIIRQVEVAVGDDDQNVMYTQIKRNIHIRKDSNAPLRSHRICITGACGSGRTTQCKAIAKQYGLVHVDLAVLIRKMQEESGKAVEDVPPEYVSDEELCAAVGKRLSETDCIRKGWVLDGFPKNQSQAEFLRQSHLWPSRIIELKVSCDTVTSRISAVRRIDPVTCTAYYKSPSSVAVRQRLVQAEHDSFANVEERFKMHEENIDGVLKTFPLGRFSIPGMGEPHLLTAQIAGIIDEPTQAELAQAPQEE